MNISEGISFTASKSFNKFSPNGKFFAFVLNNTLVVRSVKTIDIVSQFKSTYAVEFFIWSPDSNFLLCANFPYATVQVFSLEHPDWRCKLDLGTDGLAWVSWCPDSRHVLTVATLNIYLTVWSLSKLITRIVVKLGCLNGLSFAPDGSSLALVEQNAHSDCILLLSCDNWCIRKRLDLEISDYGGLLWSPDCTKICAWEAVGNKNLIEVASIEEAESCKTVVESSIATVQWINNILCVSCVDNTIIIVEPTYGIIIAKLTLKAEILHDPHINVLQEVEELSKPSEFLENVSKLPPAQLKIPPRFCNRHPKVLTYENPTSYPVTFDWVPREKLKGKSGMKFVTLTNNGRLLACVSYHIPNVVWIWNMKKISLRSVVIQKSAISGLQWEPNGSRLLFCTSLQASPHMYMWTTKDMKAVPIEALGSESVANVQWHPVSKTVSASSRSKIVICEIDVNLK